MTLQQDAIIYQGETVLMPVTVYTDAAKTARKNLGGASLDYRLGKVQMDQLVLRIVATPNANGSFTTVTNPSEGEASITIALADTQALTARRYAHQVIVTDSSGKVNVVTDGHLVVKETLPSA